jgi:hypothetical protein
MVSRGGADPFEARIFRLVALISQTLTPEPLVVLVLGDVCQDEFLKLSRQDPPVPFARLGHPGIMEEMGDESRQRAEDLRD